MVGGTLGGEDSTGRAFLRLQTPEEMVSRAFSVADLFIDEAMKRNELRERPEVKRPTLPKEG
jgi:hypothetical protein